MNEPVLIADIGGTNARFALAEPGERRPILSRITRLATADFDRLDQAAAHYLSGLELHPTRAAIAVASPVQGEEIQLTNRAWSFNRRELAASLGLEELHILNDFGAIARAVTQLQPGEYECLGGPTRDELEMPISVVGPGTGLGMSLLVQCSPGTSQVVETEGGHISYAPLGSEEQRIHQWLSARHGRVSVERALSGPGLAEIHAALSGMPPEKSDSPDSALRPPAEIVAAALSGDEPLARATLARFCAILGSVAGDAALIHGARSMAVAGGIVPRFIPFLKASAFRERFLDKGRFAAHLEGVQVIVMTHPEPGLLGTALSMLPSRSSATS